MKIKICGLKTIRDSFTACEAGADMLGFNFYEPSPRYVSIESCKKIVADVRRLYPQIICVGIFVNEDPLRIKSIMAEADLDLAQLSGNELPSSIDQLGSFAFKAVHPKSLQESKKFINSLPRRQTPPAFLIDTHQKGAYGGTGKTANWRIAADIAKEYPILLAGGLNPDNIAAAIKEVNPWGVDVASGVEINRGIKDRKKIEKFIQVAHAANTGNH
jgi:phosphoribosylanthranilate isomerase